MAACGGGGSDGLIGGANSRVSFAELDARYFTIADKFDDSISNISPPATLPISGNVGYNGVVSFEAQQVGDPRLEVLGQLSMTASFGNSSVSGSINNFVDNNETAYSGAMSLRNGEIRRDISVEETYTFIADLSGVLTSPVRTITAVDTLLLGDFFGESEEFIDGRMGGNIRTSDGVALIELTGSNSFVVGERR